MPDSQTLQKRYQHGSVRKVSGSQGFAWEFRFYLTAPDGKRKLRVQIFDSLKYPTSGTSAKPSIAVLGAGSAMLEASIFRVSVQVCLLTSLLDACSPPLGLQLMWHPGT